MLLEHRVGSDKIAVLITMEVDQIWFSAINLPPSHVVGYVMQAHILCETVRRTFKTDRAQTCIIHSAL